MEIGVHQIAVGDYQTNCYLLVNHSSKNEAIVIDPGDEPERILDCAKKLGATIKTILLTHGHFDHIAGVTAIKKATNAPVYIHKLDDELLKNPDLIRPGMLLQMSKGLGYQNDGADFFFEDLQILSFDKIEIKVIHTPGHTKGSCCFVLEDAVVTGDTLFRSSMGRTDLYGGDEQAIFNSLKKLSALDDSLTVYPGHGHNSTIQYEKRTNPFITA